MQSRSHSREPHTPVKLRKNDVSRRTPPRTLDESIHDDRIFVKVRPLIVGELGDDRGLFFLSSSTFVLANDLIANAVILQNVVDMTAALRRLDQNGEDPSAHSIAALPPFGSRAGIALHCVQRVLAPRANPRRASRPRVRTRPRDGRVFLWPACRSHIALA